MVGCRMKKVRSPFRVTTVGICLLLAPSSRITGAAQQQLTTRVIYTSVTDPQGRFVTGLEPEHFQIFESRRPQRVTGFAGVDSSISVVIVDTSGPSGSVAVLGTSDHISYAASVPDAVRKFATSKSERRGIILIGDAPRREQIPSDIKVMEASVSSLNKVIIELRNQYVLRFQSPALLGPIEIIVKPPEGLPALKANWRE